VHAPLVWRRRAPVAVFWTVFGLALVAGIAVGVRVEGMYPELVVGCAIYTVARHGPRRHLIPIVAVIEIPAVVVFLVSGPHWTALGFVSSVLAATVLLGVVVSTRQAYLAELEERARRLERERDQQARLAAAAERERIARDMHDIVAHNLAVMVALADGAALTATAAPERAADAMHKVSATGRQALGEMRRLLGILRDGTPRAGDPGAPPGGATRLAPQPGLGDVDRLVEQVRAAGLRVSLTTDGVPGEWGPGAGLAVYRIVQGAHQHAQARRAGRRRARPAPLPRSRGGRGDHRRRRLPPGRRRARQRRARAGGHDRTGRRIWRPRRGRAARGGHRLAGTRAAAFRRRGYR
jgi:signal transduction histidine kinase